MNTKPIVVLLVDDNRDDNFFHERTIKKNHPEYVVVAKDRAMQALEYLKSNKEKDVHPDLIFLDINMPAMNGWEFLVEYNRLEKKLQCRAVIIMLTTPENSDDVARAKTWSFVSEYRTKPLTPEIVKEVIIKYVK
jgi:response regulator RpfG family c-di-GMP phosphodiesterase